MTKLARGRTRRIGPYVVAVIGTASLAAVLSLAHPVLAHSGATGIVKQRMDLMKSIGQSMKTLTAMFRGKAPYDKAVIVKLSNSLSQHSKKIDKTMFPEGSNKPPSEALPIIWEDWDEFEKIAKQLEVHSAALAKTAENGTKADARRTFVALAKTCNACHAKFRIKKNAN